MKQTPLFLAALALVSGFSTALQGELRTSVQPFGRTPAGEEVQLIALRNSSGMEVSLITWGVTLLEVRVPDRTGRLENVNLRLDSLDRYLAGHPMLGSTVGRFANRIDTGGFTLQGTRYDLTSSDPKTKIHIHGGKSGFHAQNWTLQQVQQDATTCSALLTLLSPHGHEGYPGTVRVSACVSLSDANELGLHYEAVTDQPTHVNLTNHSYWNLGGAQSGPVLQHVLQLAAGRVLEFDTRKIPTGKLLPVEGTPFDFRTPRALAERIGDTLPGYDHCYVLDAGPGNTPVFAARLEDPATGRVMEISTTAPGLQLYTANHLSPSLQFQGHAYGPHHGVCLECQSFPDSPNKAGFPSTLLLPGQVYRSAILHRFSVGKPETGKP